MLSRKLARDDSPDSPRTPPSSRPIRSIVPSYSRQAQVVTPRRDERTRAAQDRPRWSAAVCALQVAMLSDDAVVMEQTLELHGVDHGGCARSKWLISALRGRLRAIQAEGLKAHLEDLQAVLCLPSVPENAAVIQEALSRHGPFLAGHGLVDDVRSRLISIKVSVSRDLQAVIRNGNAAEIEAVLERCSSLLSDEELQHGRKAVVASQIAQVAERLLGAPNREKALILRRLIEQGTALELDYGQLSAAKEVLAAVESDVRDVCAICFDEEKSTFQLACCGRSTGSAWICHDCLAPLASCPFCRRPCRK